MNLNLVNQTRKSSKKALKGIYYVIIAIAITEALSRTFLENGNFLGWKILDINNLPKLFLFIIFIPTISRFVHGASIHLDIISEKKYKPLVDFMGFFLQAALFYLMATALKEPAIFIWLLMIMLSFDALWLIILRVIGYIIFDKTSKQWIVSDAIFIIIIFLLILFDPLMLNLLSLFIILIVTIVLSIADYYMNKEFYFPSEDKY